LEWIEIQMAPSSPRTAIDTFAWLVEEAFDGDPSHSLLANLHDLREEDWTAKVAGSGRSIADILEHVGWSKWMYEDYAFGSASMRGDQPPLVPEGGAHELGRMAAHPRHNPYYDCP
jgi:hypothetical protein